MNYTPPPELIEACKRVDEERKERCEKILKNYKLKLEKEKLERQKGKKK